LTIKFFDELDTKSNENVQQAKAEMQSDGERFDFALAYRHVTLP
jgi:hypothetical protein